MDSTTIYLRLYSKAKSYHFEGAARNLDNGIVLHHAVNMPRTPNL